MEKLPLGAPVPVDRGSVGQPGELLTLGGRVHRPGCPWGRSAVMAPAPVPGGTPGTGSDRLQPGWHCAAATRLPTASVSAGLRVASEEALTLDSGHRELQRVDPFAPSFGPAPAAAAPRALCGPHSDSVHSLTPGVFAKFLLWVRALGHDLPGAPGTPPSLWTPCPQPDTQTDFRWASDEGSQGARDEDEASWRGQAGQRSLLGGPVL